MQPAHVVVGLLLLFSSLVSGKFELVMEPTKLDGSFSLSSSGVWTLGTDPGALGGDFYYTKNSMTTVLSTMTMTPIIPYTAYFDLYIWYSANGGTSYDKSALVVIVYQGGTTTTYTHIDMTTGGSRWRFVGSFEMYEGLSSTVTISSQGATEFVIADAFRLVEIDESADTYPSSIYLPFDAQLTVDANSLPFQAAVNITFTTETSTNVGKYEIRFGSTLSDRDGQLIAKFDNTATNTIANIVYTNNTRLYTTNSDGTVTYTSSSPIYVNIFILSFRGTVNPVPLSLEFTDVVLPAYSFVSGLSFTDESETRDHFQGSFTMYLDETALKTTTDYSVSTITAYVLTDPITGEILAEAQPVSGLYFVQFQTNFSLSSTGANIVHAKSKNSFGSGPAVPFQLTDLVPSQLVLANSTSVALQITKTGVAYFTPEKLDSLLAADGAHLQLNYGDYYELRVPTFLPHTVYVLSENSSINITNSPMTFTTSWYIDDRAVASYSNKSLTDTYGPLMALTSHAGVYKVGIRGTQNTTASGPEITVLELMPAINITVLGYPTAPDTGVPASLTFTDTDLNGGEISGTLSWSESTNADYIRLKPYRQFDYFVVYLTDLAALPADHSSIEPFAVVARSSSATGTYTLDVPSDTVFQSYFHITAFETLGTSAESSAYSSLKIEDNAVDATLPLVTSATFVDEDGNVNSVRGTVSFTFPQGISNITAIMVFAASSWRQSDRLLTIGTYMVQPTDVAGGTGSITLNSSLALLLDDQFITYFHVYSTLNLIALSDPFAVRVIDRTDPYWFVNYLSKVVGIKGDTGVTYYPEAVQTTSSDGSIVGGSVSFTWHVPSLSNTTYDVNEGGDGGKLIDLTEIFRYDMQLGSGEEGIGCRLTYIDGTQSGLVPAGGPLLQDVATYSQGSLFVLEMRAGYDELETCGFTQSAAHDLTLQGTVSLLLHTIAERTDSAGSWLVGSHQQVEIQADVTVHFIDTTHASIGSVVIDNVGVVADVTQQIDTQSKMRFYREGFIGLRDSYSFRAHDDTMYVEHYVLTNTDLFYMQAYRIWFAPEAFATSLVEYELPGNDAAFTNVDNPPQHGRYRFATAVPIVMNCRPCYMHIQSRLSIQQVSKRLRVGTQSIPEDSSTVKALVIDVPQTQSSGSASPSVVAPSLVGTVCALVAARMAM